MLIDRTYTSKNFRSRQDEKIQFLVLHYTEVPLATTLGIFTNNYEIALADKDYFVGTDIDLVASCNREVSPHYVNSESGQIYQLVDEQFAAYHAGISCWNGQKNINNQSIGIEQENLGFKWSSKFPLERGIEVKGDTKIWCKFSEVQITSTIALCQEIIIRHDIKPYNIVGHSDVACGRKIDPGPLFPWKTLAEAGVGMWYDARESAFNATNIPENTIVWMQMKLLEFGYDCAQSGVIDEKTISVIKAFQMHFRQDNIDGEIDLECIQILDSLCQRKMALKVEEEVSNQRSLRSTYRL